MTNFKIEYEKYFKKELKDGDTFLSYYDHMDIVDFTYNKENKLFTYPCPCGDVFIIGVEDLLNGETIARCDSCSLLVFVVYCKEDIIKYAN